MLTIKGCKESDEDKIFDAVVEIGEKLSISNHNGHVFFCNYILHPYTKDRPMQDICALWWHWRS